MDTKVSVVGVDLSSESLAVVWARGGRMQSQSPHLLYMFGFSRRF